MEEPKNTSDGIQSENIAIDKKAKYEAEKEQERKRRFAIISGNIKPIQTSFHLKEGEHVYFQIDASRKADIEYMESHTTGEANKKLGDSLLFGRERASSNLESTTTQSRSTYNETIDSGKLLFTNLRVLFIGKQVISIPHNDILSIQFVPNIRLRTTSLIMKYPAMNKNENYVMQENADSALYYTGIQRLLGNDKSNITEAEVPMRDYPDYISEKAKKEKKKRAFTTKIFIWTGIFVFMAVFLRDIIMPFNYVMIVALFLFGIIYIVLLLDKVTTKQYSDETRNRLKKFSIWLFLLFFFGIIITATLQNGNQSISINDIKKPTIVRSLTDKQLEAKKQVDAEYKTKISPIIDQLVELEKTSLDKQQNSYTNNAYASQITKDISVLVDKYNQIKSVPSTYKDYHDNLGLILNAFQEIEVSVAKPSKYWDQPSPCADETIQIAENNFKTMELNNIRPINNNTRVDYGNLPVAYMSYLPNTKNTTYSDLNFALSAIVTRNGQAQDTEDGTCK